MRRKRNIRSRRALTVAGGAEFHAVLEELPDGQWRASAKNQFVLKSSADVQTSDIEMFATEEQARTWVDVAAAALGFEKYRLDLILHPKVKLETMPRAPKG